MKSMGIKRAAILLSAVIGALLLSGCVDMSFPLIDPDSATVDTRLLGVWKSVESSDSKSDNFETLARSSYTGHPSGMMVRQSSSYDREQGKASTSSPDYFVVSTINGYNYASVFMDGVNFRTTRACYIYRYRVNGDELEWWSGADKVEDALVKQGVIRKDDVTSLVHYLENNSGDDLFPPENKGVYQRIGGASSPSTPDSTAPSSGGTAPHTLPSPAAPVVPPAAPAAPSLPVTPAPASSSNMGVMIPWIILAFVAGVYVAGRFMKRR